MIGAPVPFNKQPYFPPVRYENEYLYRISTISKPDGSYEFKGFIPPNILEIAYYLGGCDIATEDGRNTCYFYVEIHVEADGYVQGKENVPRVPLVTEELLVPARRLMKCMIQISPHSEQEKQEFREREILPNSCGNTITGIDIVLKKAGDVGQ
ncbi:MAG: hypothetical protein KKD14_00530 [Verrucomicrobia bacterium]|nr:hypothetical protein [Actinomycetota bacterium]MBU4246831.1 hypothetical protein [Verrucomicrobiota bacterium]MCG2681025.1 hypothetical protein [Kiritimatiellia bacterium]